MQDLLLFAENGLLEFQDTETGKYILTKGRIICFEKSSKIWRTLRDKLVNAIVERNFEKYLSNNIKGLSRGSLNIFPVDCINLDYDGNISKIEVPISIIIQHLLDLQAIHKKDFSLFLTWPNPYNDSDDEPG